MSGLYLISCSIWAFLDFTKAKANSDTNVESYTSYPAIVAIVGVSVITLAVICWTLTFFCTDCYNAEVDSTSHPACQSSGVGIALSSQPAQQDEGLDLTNKYLHGPPSQQPLHLHQYYPPGSNIPPQHQYSNLPNSGHCSNTCPKPSAPTVARDVQSYQNYQGYNSMHGYNNLPPTSYPSSS